MLRAPRALGLSRRDRRKDLRDDTCSAVVDLRCGVCSSCARLAPSLRLEGGALALTATCRGRVRP